MEYTINRYEKKKDHDGNITRIFIATVASDESGSSAVNEYFLTSEEMELVLADEDNLTDIIEESCAHAEIRMDTAIATKPQPSEEMDGAKKSELEGKIDKQKIKTKKVKIKNK